MANHLDQLQESLTKLAGGGLCVAFSGGVDSAVLLAAACRVAKPVHALTIYTPFHSPAEPREAAKLAESLGAAHHILRPELPQEVWHNPENRCYLCKKGLFSAIGDYARELGVAHILDGTNADDLNQYRPGLKALAELGVHSPLAELGITKASVRAMARELSLTVAEKPSAPCLATRFPYGTTFDQEALRRVDSLEESIKALGISIVRCRVHGDTVRIEAPPDYFPQLLEQRETIILRAKQADYHYITMDLQGFRSGSMDEPLKGVPSSHR